MTCPEIPEETLKKVGEVLRGHRGQNEGMKWDDGKPMLELVPPGTLDAIGEVMTECIRRKEKPYAINSWKHVKPRHRYLGAVFRHLSLRMAGEVNDKKSKLPHMWHVLTNVAFLVWFESRDEEILPPEYDPKKSETNSD